MFYIAPQLKQAKRVAWQYAVDLARMTGGKPNKAELSITWPGGNRFELLGADNPDALRGAYADLVIFDETAQMPSNVWTEIVRPMLADRGTGEAIFIGTPKGRQNLLYDLWQTAASDDFGEWSRFCYKASETDRIAAKELASMRRQMSPEEYSQEFECSFAAVQVGAYYGALMSEAQTDGRITRVAFDKTLPVICSLDLGFNDATVVWHGQPAGNELRLIKAEAFQGQSLVDIMAQVQQNPWPIKSLIVPHDVRQHELTTGRTRLEVLEALGFECEIAHNWAVDEGIEAVRNLLPRCIFDLDGCKVGIEALSMYHSEYDEVRRVYKPRPVHDWSSDYADSFRYMAVMLPDVIGYSKARKRNQGYRQGII